MSSIARFIGHVRLVGADRHGRWKLMTPELQLNLRVKPCARNCGQKKAGWKDLGEVDWAPASRSMNPWDGVSMEDMGQDKKNGEENGGPFF